MPLAAKAGQCPGHRRSFQLFQLPPHVPVGVSEVHLILGATRFLLFGEAPTAIGLAFGLLLQGLSFAPFDLPHYRLIAHCTAYVDLRYGSALALSLPVRPGSSAGWRSGPSTALASQATAFASVGTFSAA